MRPESDHFTPTAEYPHPEWWKARDGEASEEEVGDFLYGLVRLVQPECVVETGCYLGDTSLRIAQALQANGHGWLHTCDIDAVLVGGVIRRLGAYRASAFVSTGAELIQITNPDLAFIDSGGDREKEISLLPDGCLVVLHDARWYKNPALFFPTPRGISLFRVNHGKTER